MKIKRNCEDVRIYLEQHSVAGEYFLTFKRKGPPPVILWLLKSELKNLKRVLKRIK